MTSQNKLIINTHNQNLLNELQKSLRECKSFYFSVAFINFSGLQLLLDTFKELEDKGVKGKIITSTYLNFTDPKALDRIRSFNNIDLKVFITNKEIGFHTKVYIFEYEDSYKVIIGSSNITQSALKSNIEWNVEIISKEEEPFIENVLREYNKLYNMSSEVNDELLENYNNFLKELKQSEKTAKKIFENYTKIVPNAMQKRAIENLSRLRNHGEDKALVIAATGTGKTYMSAFDVREYNPSRLLFLVHRGEILNKAKETFDKLLKDKNIETGLFTGGHKEVDAPYLFATIQTMQRHYKEFNKDHFDYIVVDEAHHAASNSYTEVLDYFTPKFTLGMTATPERSDTNNIFELFDNNVALEVRLNEALEEELIIPFHYFGGTDAEGVDLSEVNIEDIATLTKKLKVNERVDFIIEKMNFYGHDGDSRKCLGFCVSIDHAQYMAEEFNKRGIASVALSGADSIAKRDEYIKRLEDSEDELEVIFSVDIFNEGVDIPSINTVLMLRPTNSPIVFIQQLGRGLRKHDSKEFLTVLDFIGNHSKTFLIAIALNGSRYYDKDSLKVAVATNFANVPGCTHIQIDEIAKERILEQIDSENFRAMKYLKEEYNEFKITNSGRSPYLLLDYIKYEGSPDPIKFIDKEKTYIGFVAKMEKDEELKKLLLNSDFVSALKELSSKLPIKRVYEFAILKYLMKNEVIDFAKAKSEILKYIKEVDEDSIYHAFEYLNQNYYDVVQKNGKLKLVEYIDGKLYKSEAFSKVIEDRECRKYIEDVINYGIIRYEKEFKEEYYGVPFFKLYEQYQMIDAAYLSNYRKIHSSFRGSGLLVNGKDYFLFIDLHKEEGIEERINYDDKFLSERFFQWQSPNAIKTDSERGQNIIFNKDKGVNLHLFVRKYREIDGKVEPFIYIGKGDTVESKGEKPITVKLKLENEVPVGLYREFVERV